MSTGQVNDQGRAAVLGLQRTVDAAFQAQADQLVPLDPDGRPLPRAGTTPGITIEQLTKVMPRLAKDKAAQYLPLLNAAMAEAKISTPQRQAAFLAQLAHESVELKYFDELGGPGYFDKYNGRKDLGNTQPGDGPRYKGRGPIQLTGRSNYRRAGQALGLDLEGNPPLAAEPSVGFRTAGWFWTDKNLNPLADAGNFREITRRINGGVNGLAAREAYYATAKKALGI